MTFLQFRFRGKYRRILALYQCFLDLEKRALHPAEISRYAGVTLHDASIGLEQTPELFLKLSSREDGLTRYALTPSIRSRKREEVEKFVMREVKRETRVLYAIVIMMVTIFLAGLMITIPNFYYL